MQKCFFKALDLTLLPFWIPSLMQSTSEEHSWPTALEPGKNVRQPWAGWVH